MELARWFTLAGLSFFLAEGFFLSVYPTQFKEFLVRADPRWLQMAGLVETVIAISLIGGTLAL